MLYYNPNQSFMGASSGWPGFSSPMGFGSPMSMMHMMPAAQMMGSMSGYWTPQRMQAAQGMNSYNPEPYQMQTMEAPAGASRPGMQYRAARRKAKQQGTYDPSAAPAGPIEPGRIGGAPPQPGWANNPNAMPGSEAMAGFFNSPFGQLTTASGGNSNMFKRLGGSEHDGMFFFDPNAGGWQQTSLNDYRAGAGASAVNPNQQQYRDAAGIQRQQFQRTNVPPHLLGKAF